MGLSPAPEPRASRDRGRRDPDAAPGLAAREAARALLSGVIDGRHPLDGNDLALAGLSAEDRGLARAIAGTALRRHGELRAALAGLIARPLPGKAGPLPAILTVAAAQILFMDVPDHAAVSVAMAAAEADPNARHFKPLANAVLRSLVRGREEILAEADAAILDTPDWLWRRWVAAYGEPVARAIAAAHLVEPPLDLSVKADPEGWAARLGGAVLPTGSVRVTGKGRIEALPGYDEGAWWVQDAAAALPARLFGDLAGRNVLDLCAAPGGKTAQLVLAGARVTALDLSAERVERLAANLKRLGLEAECVAADAFAYEPGRLFDAVLVDAPCSATGTIRRHPDIPFLKRESDLAPLALLQRRLIDKAASLTRPGGIIVYASCSLEPEEGEAHAKTAASGLALEPWPIAAGEVAGLSADWLHEGHLRTLPSHEPGPGIAGGIAGGIDGFFATRFRRR